MPGRFTAAVETARTRHGEAWDFMNPRARSAAIFHELCRIDSGCKRTGTDADRDLPPCPASDSFIARRNCRLAGPRQPAEAGVEVKLPAQWGRGRPGRRAVEGGTEETAAAPAAMATGTA